MKKLVVSALALTLISFASVQAQTANQTTEKHAEHQQATAQKSAKADQEDKVAVKPEDLPEGIKQTIKRPSKARNSAVGPLRRRFW
jgi:uncharacterized protein HemX